MNTIEGSLHVERVTGIGGIFVKAEDPTGLQKWYQEKLGVPGGEEGLHRLPLA